MAATVERKRSDMGGDSSGTHAACDSESESAAVYTQREKGALVKMSVDIKWENLLPKRLWLYVSLMEF